MKTFRLWIGGGVLGGILVVAAAWFLLLTPARKSIADTKAATAQLQTNNDQLRAQADQLRAESSQLPAKEAQLAKVAAAVPSQTSQSPLVTDLQAKAAAAHVTWIKLVPGSSTSTGSAATGTTGTTGAAGTTTAGTVPAYDTLPLNIDVQGTYAQLEEYVQSLQSSPRLYVVKSFVVAPIGNTGAAASSRLDATINANVYTTASGITDVPAALTALEANLAGHASASPAATK